MLKMVIPKGRIQENVLSLLNDIGVQIWGDERNYRPTTNEQDLEIKKLKSQNIPQLIELGQHDCGFAGLDWIQEKESKLEQMMDLELNPVKIVACIPENWDWSELKQRKILAVSEYRRLCCSYLDQLGVDYTCLRSYGATEVFPPEDADLIVDNTSTGTTLKENGLKIIDTLLESSTWFIASSKALEDRDKRARIENYVTLFQSVLDGRSRVLLEMNCPSERLDTIVKLLPAMKTPTICELYGKSGFSVKAAVLRKKVKDLLPVLLQNGATDILETQINKVIS